MKILELRKKIIVNASIAGVTLVLFCGCIFYNIHHSAKVKEDADKITNETAEIQSKTADLQSKTLDIQKYMATWRNLDESKKSANGIKMDEVNNLLNSTATKYNITTPNIKISLPEPLNDGVFNCKTISVSSTTATLTFKALDDVKALLFVSDFARALPGYAVINNLDIKKEKDYANNDLVDISTGKASGVISGSATLYWYAFKNKIAAAPTPADTPPTKTN